jgi:hypothetical protein
MGQARLLFTQTALLRIEHHPARITGIDRKVSAVLQKE